MSQDWLGGYRRLMVIALAAVCGIASASSGQARRLAGAGDGANPPAMQITNETPLRQIRTNVLTRRVYQQMLAAGIIPTACRPGLGMGEYFVTAQHEALLQQLEQPYEVLIEDVNEHIRAERERIVLHNQQLEAGLRGVSWYDDYKDLDQINTRIDEIVAAHPTLASKFDIGDSLEGRSVFGIRISGDGSVKPAVLFNGCQHAREWISPMTTMYIAEQLLNDYATDASVQDLVDSTEIFIVPVVNPDGYEYSWTTSRFWRKNRRDNGDGSFGIDLNRNWDKDWGGPFSSGSTGSDSYRGPSVFSEPETQNLRDFVLATPQLVAHIDYHSFAQEVLGPWAFVEPYASEPADFESVVSLGRAMRDAIFDVHGMAYPNSSGAGGVGLASGVCPDWTTEVGLVGFTIEVRPSSSGLGGFDPPPATILPTGQENFAGALAMAEFAATLPVDWDGDISPPAILPPDTLSEVSLTFQPRGGLALESATAVQYTQSAARGSWDQSPLVHITGDTYEAALQAGACGEQLNWYLQIETTDGYTFTVPRGAPDAFFTSTAAEMLTLVDDDFETDQGWTTSATASDGDWQRGVPVNDPSWPYDPVTDGDGSGQCWLTKNTAGNSDVDGGSVTLTSPAYDMSGSDQWFISYRYFAHLTNIAIQDNLAVEISSNGLAGPWTQIALHNTNSALLWRTNLITQDELDAAGITLTADMRLRFIASDLGGGHIVEAAIDGLNITGIACPLPGDVTNDGIVNLDDLLEVISNWGSDGTAGGDADGDGDVDLQDLLLVISNWGQSL